MAFPRKLKPSFDLLILTYLAVLTVKFIGFGSEWLGIKYIPDMRLAGNDFRICFEYAHDYLIKNIKAPWIYPPFSTYYFFPFLKFGIDTALIIHSLILVMCYFYAIKLSASIYTEKINLKFTGLITLLVFFSYPVVFSLERGNLDLIALLFMTLFLKEYSKSPWSAILYLTMATQFKIYPLYLAFLFFNKKNFKYFAFFVILNFVLLFSGGLETLEIFLQGLNSVSSGPYVWAGNHSLSSFVKILSNKYLFFRGYGAIFTIALSILAVFCWTLSLKNNFKESTKEALNLFVINSFIIACLFTPVSHDYKLVILLPVLIFDSLDRYKNGKYKVFNILCIMGLMHSFSLSPYYYNNKCLILILLFISYNWPSIRRLAKRRSIPYREMLTTIRVKR